MITNLEFSANTICARHKQRILISSRPHIEHASKKAKVTLAAWSHCLRGKRFYALNKAVSSLYTHPTRFVRQPALPASHISYCLKHKHGYTDTVSDCGRGEEF